MKNPLNPKKNPEPSPIDIPGKVKPDPATPCGFDADNDASRAAREEASTVANPASISGWGFGKD